VSATDEPLTPLEPRLPGEVSERCWRFLQCFARDEDMPSRLYYARLLADEIPPRLVRERLEAMGATERLGNLPGRPLVATIARELDLLVAETPECKVCWAWEMWMGAPGAACAGRTVREIITHESFNRPRLAEAVAEVLYPGQCEIALGMARNTMLRPFAKRVGAARRGKLLKDVDDGEFAAAVDWVVQETYEGRLARTEESVRALPAHCLAYPRRVKGLGAKVEFLERHLPHFTVAVPGGPKWNPLRQVELFEEIALYKILLRCRVSDPYKYIGTPAIYFTNVVCPSGSVVNRTGPLRGV
jgi:hypothetical protein